jgi:HEAT repeat protein
MDSEDEAITEAAIWALGQSRRPAAVEALKDKWERTVDRSARKALVGALAASRLQEAIDFLGSQLQSTDLATAGEILGALSNYGSNEAVRQSVASAVEERGDRGLTALFHQYFPLK